MTAKKPRTPGMACPHCGSRTIARDSMKMSPITRELRMICDNIECGFYFVAHLSITRAVRPSMCPNPAIQLPMGNWGKPPANDDHPDPANDQNPPAASGDAPMSG